MSDGRWIITTCATPDSYKKCNYIINNAYFYSDNSFLFVVYLEFNNNLCTPYVSQNTNMWKYKKKMWYRYCYIFPPGCRESPSDFCFIYEKSLFFSLRYFHFNLFFLRDTLFVNIQDYFLQKKNLYDCWVTRRGNNFYYNSLQFKKQISVIFLTR